MGVFFSFPLLEYIFSTCFSTVPRQIFSDNALKGPPFTRALNKFESRCPMHAILQRVLKLALRVQDGYFEFYFSPGSVHCP